MGLFREKELPKPSRPETHPLLEPEVSTSDFLRNQAEQMTTRANQELERAQNPEKLLVGVFDPQAGGNVEAKDALKKAQALENWSDLLNKHDLPTESRRVLINQVRQFIRDANEGYYKHVNANLEKQRELKRAYEAPGNKMDIYEYRRKQERLEQDRMGWVKAAEPWVNQRNYIEQLADREGIDQEPNT